MFLVCSHDMLTNADKILSGVVKNRQAKQLILCTNSNLDFL